MAFIEFSKKDFWTGGFGDAQSPTPKDLIQLKQVHSDQWLVLEAPYNIEEVKKMEGDGILTQAKGISIGIRTADCVPILLAHPAGWVGAVHAGWKGTRLQILAKILRFLGKDTKLEMSELHLAIGPAISGQVYEVGPEVHEAFGEAGSAFFQPKGNKYLLDLPRANRQQALVSGVLPENIYWFQHCTFQDEDYHSYRRRLLKGEENGPVRNYSWISLNR